MVAPDPVWVGSLVVRVGALHVGLRSDDPRALQALRSMYERSVVDDDRAASDYAIRMTGAPTGAGLRIRPFVARGRCPLLRSESLPRLLRHLDLALAGLVSDAVSGTVSLNGVAAVVADRRAVLVPASLVERSSGVERTLRDAGVGIAEELGLRLDPVSGEIVVPKGLVGSTRIADATGVDDGLAVESGRHRVESVHWSRQVLGEDEHPSAALVRLLTAAEDRVGLERSALLRSLAAMRPTFSHDRIGERGTADIARAIESLRR